MGQITQSTAELQALLNRELSTSLTETVTGKAADATVIKLLNDNTYPRLQNGNGSASNIDVIMPLISMGFSLAGANLSYTDFSNADLSNADLSNAYLENANLSYADLFYADFSNADLFNANLSNTNLYYAYLANAYLENANLENAYLSSAYLNGANLDGAYLENAIGLNSDINVALANVNKDTYQDGTTTWTLIWTDGNSYTCDPVTGLFTQN